MITYKQVIEIVSERKVECKTDSQMRAGQPGPLPAKSAGPTAKLRASGPRARSKKRPAHYPVFKSNRNQQRLYCVKTIHISKFRFVLSNSILPAVISCKISAPEVK